MCNRESIHSMLFLILHVVFVSSFALMIKYYQASGRNLLVVGAINYVVAALAVGASIIYKGSFGLANSTWIIGILAGIAYFVSYFLLINAVKTSGISITWSVVRLSVLIPVLFSIFYWREQPSSYQIGGIACVCLSLPLLSIRPGGDGKPGMPGKATALIIALFVASGGTNLTAKAFSEISPGDQRQMYLLFLFSTAAIVTVLATLVRRARPKLVDIPFGIVLGLCNLLAGYFLLLALMKLPGMLVFPISGSMSIALTTLAGMAIWHERLRKPAMLGVIVAVIAVVLINLD